ncbi:MAG: hypothetical protein DRP51_01295 [Candidatus Zixiibacteriota bacterium]|nr:MAG: hypothetical protein DRP51_01295 [candidate division Zixibacteria bacterium]
MKVDSLLTKRNFSDFKEKQYLSNGDISRILCSPLLRILRQNKSIPDLFCEMTNKLSKFFSISKAVLVIRNHNKMTLGVMAIWDNFQFQNGLTLILPKENSFLYEIFKTGRIKSLPIFSRVPGNLIENKILVNKSDSALVVCPMISEDMIRGLISFSSPVPYAFEMIEEEYLGTIFDMFGRVLSDDYNRKNKKINVERET